MLGICLGAQLMARALGARVYPAGVKEIGWAPHRAERGRAPLAAGAAWARARRCCTGMAIPSICRRARVHLAATRALRRTRPSPGERHGLALQFHLEITARGLERWYVGHTLEIATTEGVSVPALRADAARHAAGLTQAGAAMLDAWLAPLGL